MKRPLAFAALVLASLSLFACAAEDDSAGESKGSLTSDIHSMIVNPDGTYTVTCKDGSVEKHVTAEDIESSNVCNDDADAGDEDADIDGGPSEDAALDASKDAALDSKDAALDAPKDAALDASKDAALDASKDAALDAKDASIDI